MRLCSVGLVLAVVVLSACAPAGEDQVSEGGEVAVKGGMDETGPYDVVADWPKPAKNHDDRWTWGVAADVVADTPDRIFIVTRGDVRKDDPASSDRRPTNFIVVVDRNGNEIENWSQWDTMMAGPHSIAISPYDPERHIWVQDNSRQQVWKFSNDGQLVQTWGEANVIGDDENHFNGVSSIAFLPDGSFLLGDGYVGQRIVKYDADGEYVTEWGAGGPMPFNRIHAVAVDSQRRVIVSDRNNSRIQVFTENGEFIEEWPKHAAAQLHPCRRRRRRLGPGRPRRDGEALEIQRGRHPAGLLGGGRRRVRAPWTAVRSRRDVESARHECRQRG